MSSERQKLSTTVSKLPDPTKKKKKLASHNAYPKLWDAPSAKDTMYQSLKLYQHRSFRCTFKTQPQQLQPAPYNFLIYIHAYHFFTLKKKRNNFHNCILKQNGKCITSIKSIHEISTYFYIVINCSIDISLFK